MPLILLLTCKLWKEQISGHFYTLDQFNINE